MEDSQLVEKYPLLKYFKYDHLPEALQIVSKPFCDLAFASADLGKDPREVAAGIRHLLEAKDCIVRSALG